MSTYNDILSSIDYSEITLTVARGDYMASKIAHAVEDSDSQLLGLRLAAPVHDDGRLTVVITVNRRDPSSVVRSLERYGYPVVDVQSSESIDDETARRRALELLHLLEL